jgi:hypothetical protein
MLTTVNTLLERVALKHPNRPALIFQEQAFMYQQMN